jgi:hypothetical protein
LQLRGSVLWQRLTNRCQTHLSIELTTREQWSDKKIEKSVVPMLKSIVLKVEQAPNAHEQRQ